MDELTKQFNTEIDKVSVAAFQAPRGGDDNWNKVLESYGVQPLTQDIKDALLKSDMKIARGAFPVELRKIYLQILAKYPDKVNSFDMEGEVIKYYQKIKPFGGMNDIFKNASTTLTKYSQGLRDEKQSTFKCKSCGAPRLEEMQYDECMFCGSKLFVPTG